MMIETKPPPVPVPAVEATPAVKAPSFLLLRLVLILLTLLSLVEGLRISGAAETIMHQLAAFLWYLISAVLFSASAIIEAMRVMLRQRAESTNNADRFMARAQEWMRSVERG